MSAILPKYKCEAIAREVNRLLMLAPALTSQQVRDYGAPDCRGSNPPSTSATRPRFMRGESATGHRAETPLHLGAHLTFSGRGVRPPSRLPSLRAVRPGGQSPPFAFMLRGWRP